MNTNLVCKSFFIFDILNLNVIDCSLESKIMSIASLTKLFTVYYFLELLSIQTELTLFTPVTLNYDSSKTFGTNVKFVTPKCTMTIEDLIYSVLMVSCNKCAFAMAVIGGKLLTHNILKDKYVNTNITDNIYDYIKIFLEELKIFYSKLGYKYTVIHEPCGNIENQNFSNCIEVCKILILLNNKIFTNIVLKSKLQSIVIDNITYDILSTNILLPEIWGKTGYNISAGGCFAGIFNNNYIIIVLGSSLGENYKISLETRFNDVKILSRKCNL